MKTLKMLATATMTSLLALMACGESGDATWMLAPAADDAVENPGLELAEEDGLEVLASAAEADDAADTAAPTTPPLGTTRQALGNNCKNVSINITNLRERDGQTVPILVRYVKYWNAAKGDWVEEGLDNTQVNYEASATFTENLEGAEGDDILSWRVYYSYSTGNEWSGTYYQYIDTPNEECRDGISVELEIR